MFHKPTPGHQDSSKAKIASKMLREEGRSLGKDTASAYYVPSSRAPSFFLRTLTWWTFRIFLIFFLLGSGEGGVQGAGRGGGGFFMENPRKGGLPGGGGVGGEGVCGREGVCGEFGGGGGGGLNIFF